MAYSFYMTIEGTKQGRITGSSTRKGKGGLSSADGMECYGFSYEVVTQIDPSTGQPVGRRQHSPITITKETGTASPSLFQALASDEALRPVFGLSGLGTPPGTGGSGTPTGGGHQGPIVITKETGTASPSLFQTVGTNNISKSGIGSSSSGASQGTGGSGTSSGQGQHNPIKVTKDVGASSPQLFQAWVTNELLKTVKINFSGDERGKTSPWYTIRLTNAVIVKINHVLIPGAKGQFEELEFSYEKIETKFGYSG